MTEDDPQAIRARLAAAREALLRESDAASDSRGVVELDQTSVGRLSRIDALQGQAMAQATERRRLDAIRRIDQALARLEAGEYGICVICGEAIAPRRLALDPAIATCLDCARGGDR